MITNESFIDTLITSIIQLEDGKIIIRRRDSDLNQTFNRPSLNPSFYEADPMSINFVKNKPVHITNATDTSGIDSLPDLSTVSLVTGEKYIKYKNNIVQFGRNIIADSEMIRIKKHVRGRFYRKGSVVFENGTLYRAIINTQTSPITQTHHWESVTEFDMFVNVCEISAPGFSGYFDVAFEYWYDDEIVASTAEEFISAFSITDDVNDLQLVNSDISLSAKSSERTTIEFKFPVDQTKRILEVSGQLNFVGLEGEYLQIGLDIKNQDVSEYGVLLTDDSSSDEDGYIEELSGINGPSVEPLPSGDSYQFTANMSDLSIDSELITEISVHFTYNDDPLSGSSISNLKIKYQELR